MYTKCWNCLLLRAAQFQLCLIDAIFCRRSQNVCCYCCFLCLRWILSSIFSTGFFSSCIVSLIHSLFFSFPNNYFVIICIICIIFTFRLSFKNRILQISFYLVNHLENIATLTQIGLMVWCSIWIRVKYALEHSNDRSYMNKLQIIWH